MGKSYCQCTGADSRIGNTLFRKEDLVACVEQARSTRPRFFKNYSQRIIRGTTGLHLTASLGLLHLSNELILRHKGGFTLLISQDSNRDTPLALASQHEHAMMVEMLIEIDQTDVDHANISGV
jgi:hypothetical protein